MILYLISVILSVFALVLTEIELFADPEEHSRLFSLWTTQEQYTVIAISVILIVIGLIRSYKKDKELYSC